MVIQAKAKAILILMNNALLLLDLYQLLLISCPIAKM